METGGHGYRVGCGATLDAAGRGAEGCGPQGHARVVDGQVFASEVAVRICNEAVQLFGGYGFIKDYPVEKFYRDVKLCTIGEGTSEIQRMVIAREILKVHPSRG
jgi:alkylation response protein AidB-like acyl-CoA dehydrogenase